MSKERAILLCGRRRLQLKRDPLGNHMIITRAMALPIVLCIFLADQSQREPHRSAGANGCTALHPLSMASRWRHRPLPAPGFGLFLPTLFRSVPSDSAVHRWVAPDLSEFQYVVTDAPLAAAAGSSTLLSHLRRPSYRLEATCQLSAAHRAAVINLFQHVDSAKTDTVFGFAEAITMGPHSYASILALTPSVAMRDSLLGSAGSLQLRHP